MPAGRPEILRFQAVEAVVPSGKIAGSCALMRKSPGERRKINENTSSADFDRLTACSGECGSSRIGAQPGRNRNQEENPKSEVRKNSNSRKPKSETNHNARGGCYSYLRRTDAPTFTRACFRFRPSDFGFRIWFGFRISDFLSSKTWSLFAMEVLIQLVISRCSQARAKVHDRLAAAREMP